MYQTWAFLQKVCILILVGLSGMIVLWGQPPNSINYSGLLTNPQGEPREGPFNMTFRIYDRPVGGSPQYQPLHEQRIDNVVVRKGQFSVLLGPFTNPNVFLQGNGDRYVELQVGNEPPLLPRQQLLSVPFAQRAASVDGVWYKIADVNLASAANYTLTGIDGNRDKVYKIYIQGQLNSVGWNRCVSVRPNNIAGRYDNIAHRHGIHNLSAWYHEPTWFCGSGDVGGLGLGMSDWNTDGSWMAEADLPALTGKMRLLQSHSSFRVTTSGALRMMSYEGLSSWGDTTTNITSLVFDFGGGAFTGNIAVFAMR